MPQFQPRRLLAGTALLAALTLSVVGCGTIPDAGGATAPGAHTESQAPTTGNGPVEVPATPSSTPTPDPVALTPNVKNKAKNVKVSTVVSVKAGNGKLDKVTLRYAGVSKGKAIKVSVDGTLA